MAKNVRAKRTRVTPKSPAAVMRESTSVTYSDPGEADGLPVGFAVIKVVQRQQRGNGDMMVVGTGYVISYTIKGQTQYAGTKLLWHGRQSFVTDHFRTEQDAVTAAVRQAEIWRYLEELQSRNAAIVEHEVKLPMVESELDIQRSISVQAKLNLEESRKWMAILKALRLRNVELYPNKPVVSRADVLRHIISLLPGNLTNGKND